MPIDGGPVCLSSFCGNQHLSRYDEQGTRDWTSSVLRLDGHLKALPVHSIIGGIALANNASVALHEKFGFEKVAHFKEVGWKFNTWVDVGYWELLVDVYG